MNKTEYLQALEKELTKNKITDLQDILFEYEQHIDMRLAEGYTETEITLMLGKPEFIAEKYIEKSDEKQAGNSVKAIKATAFVFVDFIAVLVFIMLYAWVIVMGALSITFFALAFFLTTGIRFNELIIPYMPALCGILLGITMLLLGVLTVLGTIYSHIYTIRIIKVYLRWHKNAFSPQKLPSLSLKPDLSGKFLRRTRLTAVIFSIAFIVFFFASNIALFACADFNPYWHYWNWFH